MKRHGKNIISPDVPEEVLKSCLHILLEYEYIIPSWCNGVSVSWNAREDEDSIAYITTLYEYRRADLVICPLFLNEDEEDKRLRIRHELSHILTAPLVGYCRSTVGILLKDADPILEKVIREGLREKYESLTEDLANVLGKAEERRES